MTNQQLIDRIRKEYSHSKKALFYSKKIKRGTKHTISSFTEDLFAKYIDGKIQDNYEIWIDPQISIDSLKNESGKRALQFRPDICIYDIRTNQIKSIFDIKMDLGYKRKEFVEQVDKKIKQLKKIINHEGKCSLLPEKQFKFKNNLYWNYIIVSPGNIPGDQLSSVKNFFKINKQANLFILLKAGHLNDNSPDYKPIANHQDFQKIESELKKL